jgi:hypothetical protein
MEKDWSVFLYPFDVEKEVTPACPFLQGKKGDKKRKCGIFHTHHDFWEGHCGGFPGKERDFYDVISMFKNCPNCSYEFVEE